MFNKLKKKARKASALVRGSSTSYTPGAKKGKDPSSPVDPTQPSAFAYTPVHLEFLDFSPGGAKYSSGEKRKAAAERERNIKDNSELIKRKSASLPREAFPTGRQDQGDNASLGSYTSTSSTTGEAAPDDKRHSTFSTFRGSTLIRYTDDRNTSRTDDGDLDIIDNYHQSYLEGEGSRMVVVGHHILEAPAQFSSGSSSPDHTGSPVAVAPQTAQNSAQVVKIAKDTTPKREKASVSKEPTSPTSTGAKYIVSGEPESSDQSPSSSDSSSRRIRKDTPRRRSSKPTTSPPPPPKPHRAVDILRQVAMEADPNTYTGSKGSSGKARKSSRSRDQLLSNGGVSISGDSCSLSSSVFSDTLQYTVDYQSDTPKTQYPSKPNGSLSQSDQNGYLSDDVIVEQGETTFSTFKGTNSLDAKGKETLPQTSQESGNKTKTRSFYDNLDNNPHNNQLQTHNDNYSDDTSKNSLFSHSQSINQANKSWQDVTAQSDYSMKEMLRKDESINLNTIEFSIVDEKTANDTNNNQEPELLDGMERERVEIEDWFDRSNLADHTSMIVQAMMSDVFESPTSSRNRHRSNSRTDSSGRNEDSANEHEDDSGYRTGKFLDPGVRNKFGTTHTGGRSQIEKSQENQVMTKSVTKVTTVDELQSDNFNGKTPNYKKTVGRDPKLELVRDTNGIEENDSLYDDSVMASMTKDSRKYADRFFMGGGDKETPLTKSRSEGKAHHSGEDTTNSLQYSLHDMDRIDRPGDWKFNCSYNQAMEQENILLQMENEYKLAEETDVVEENDRSFESSARLEYGNVINEKENMKESGDNDVTKSSSKLKKETMDNKSNGTNSTATFRRQKSYINAMGRQDSIVNESSPDKISVDKELEISEFDKFNLKTSSLNIPGRHSSKPVIELSPIRELSPGPMAPAPRLSEGSEGNTITLDSETGANDAENTSYRGSTNGDYVNLVNRPRLDKTPENFRQSPKSTPEYENVPRYAQGKMNGRRATPGANNNAQMKLQEITFDDSYSERYRNGVKPAKDHLENYHSGNNEGLEENVNKTNPHVVELTASASMNDSKNSEAECRDKFRQFISDLHVAEVSSILPDNSISSILPDDSHSESPGKPRPVPTPRRSKSIKKNEDPSWTRSEDRSREDISRDGACSPYDNFPSEEPSGMVDVSADYTSKSVFTDSTDGHTYKYSKVNPVLARFLKKPLPSSPGSPLNGSCLPGPQGSDSSVLVEDDYTPDPSFPILTTSSMMAPIDGSVISNNIVLEGSLSFLKNSAVSENSAVGSDGTLKNSIASDNEDETTSFRINKVFSSPTKYSFLDQDFLKESQLKDGNISESSEEEDDETDKPEWSKKPIDVWGSEDVIGWCKYSGFLGVLANFEDANSMKDMLLQDTLTDPILVEKDVTDEMTRKRFLTEISRLKSQPQNKSALLRLKQVSVKRKTLEVSSDLIKDRLYNLQRLSDDQHRRIHSSLSEIQHQQINTDRLLKAPYDRRLSASADNLDTIGSRNNSFRRHRHVTTSGVGDYDFFKVPLPKWSGSDVLDWLIYSGLHEYAHVFAANNITGQHLADINLKLLDKLGLRSTNEREQILSKLYEIQHPSGPSVVDILDGKYSKKMESPNKSHTVEGQQKTSSHDDLLTIWHDLSGEMEITVLDIDSPTPCIEVIKILLSRFSITGDTNLYYLALVKENQASKELADYDFPSKLLNEGSALRLELRQRIGTNIKVVQKLEGSKPLGKVFRMAAISTCDDILRVAFRNFSMDPADIKDYCLLEINKRTGDTYFIDGETTITNLKSDSFILCEKHRTSHGNSSHTESQGHNKTKEMDFLPSRLRQLESLEAQVVLQKMAEIESGPIRGSSAAVSPVRPLKAAAVQALQGDPDGRYVTPRKQRLPNMDRITKSNLVVEDQLELLREIALLRESLKERESQILQLQHEQSTMRQESHVSPEKSPPEVNVHHERKVDLEHKAVQCDPIPSTEESDLRQLDREWQKAGRNVALQEEKLRALKYQLDRSMVLNSDDAYMFNREVQVAEKKLLKMKQHQAELFAKVELKRRDVGKNQNKQATHPLVPPLYETLHQGPPQCIVCVELHHSSTGYGFLQGRDKNNRPVVKHVEEGRPLNKGDRLLEVNGHRLFDKTDSELQQVLREGSDSLKVVILRDLSEDRRRRSSSSQEEVASLKDDLKLAMMELESTQEEYNDLQIKIKRTEKLLTSQEKETESLKLKNEQLKFELDESEEKWRELKQHMADVRMQKMVIEGKKMLRFGDVKFPSFDTTSEDNTSVSDLTTALERNPNKGGDTPGAEGSSDGDSTTETLL